MRKIISIFILIILVSCSKKELKLPIVSEKGIQEITNFTQLWLFYEEQNNDVVAKFNQNNTISGTHWVINIDKRLVLKDVFPILEKIRKKRLKKSPHSSEGMHNYLSYSDIKSEKLSFLEIDNQHYFLKDSVVTDSSYNNINVLFTADNVIIKNDTIDKLLFKANFLDIITKEATDKKPLLHLIFDRMLTYQDYIYYKSILNNIQPNSFSISKMECLKTY